MPSTVDVSLKWTDFSKNVSESWMERVENSPFCDITLVSDDGQNINAHKIILANSSSVLRSILLESKYPVPLIYLRGVRFNELSSLLDFIYKGETNITQDHLQKFLHLAEELGVKGLNEEVRTENIPKQNFNADSGIVNMDSQLFEVKTEDISKVNPDADLELVNIDSQMFDIIGENKIGSELVKPEIIIENTTENHPLNNIRIPIETKKFTCNIDQPNLDKQILLMIIKQPLNEAIKGMDGKKKRTYKCNVCDLLSHSKEDCVNHVETHISGLGYTCTICEHIIKTSFTMKAHTKQNKARPKPSQDIDMQNTFLSKILRER